MHLKCLLLTFIISLIITPASWSKEQSIAESSIKTKVLNFKKRYGIPIIYKNFSSDNNRADFKAIASNNYDYFDNYLNLFEKETTKYPLDFFRQRRIRAIAFVTHLFSKGETAQGMYQTDTNVMFFDISRFKENKSLQRHSIHHELFHMMSLQTVGYSVNKDPQWLALNNKTFTYGKQSKRLTDMNPHNSHAPNQLGFVTYYAMSALEEDKAEIFACLMQKSHNRLITQWQKKDTIMENKVSHIKSFIKAYSPHMDDSYWESLRNPSK
ncbi:MAG: hypothetical protein ACI9E5_000720 [Candidatus Omnitrophota bacterium]|jgi:hypothetical protein